MQALLVLVRKTARWSVDELRDELLALNRLAYPHRREFDRSALMEAGVRILVVDLWSVLANSCLLACAGG